MLLILGISVGLTRRTISPWGDILVQARRPRLSSCSLPLLTGPTPPVRPLSLKIKACPHSVKMESPASTSHHPEPPDLFPPALQEPSPPPKLPTPPDPPPVQIFPILASFHHPPYSKSTGVSYLSSDLLYPFRLIYWYDNWSSIGRLIDVMGPLYLSMS
ncbi:unnamed protein product [Arabis nemorensis]|uniref:Uncharacterized protein n=1 Tax=Arabis nemorensis TaxID=586526 RepID=A0A565ATN0_9BRAS|nr:unnamed protein product [Arabis nemorensis]